MLSSLFQQRNSQNNNNANAPLFDLTAKKIQLVPSQKTSTVPNTQNSTQKQKKPKQIIQKQRPQATVFVGNVHIQTKHNQLKTLFSKYGKIEKIWFRSVPVQVNKMGRKANHILKNYVEGAQSMNAYIRFQRQQSAQQACKQNSTLFKGLNIRVSLQKQKQNDTQATIFVGNLNHDITEQQLRNHFSSIGNILSVRVIKSRQTNKGIGIGYVHFSTKQQMKEAISKFNGSQLLGRQVRIKKAVQKQRLDKKTNKIKQKFGKKYKNKKGYLNKNSKAIQIRKRGKQIKDHREISKIGKTRIIKK